MTWVCNPDWPGRPVVVLAPSVSSWSNVYTEVPNCTLSPVRRGSGGGDRHIVDVRAVGAAEIRDPEVASLPTQGGVLSGNSGVWNADSRILTPTDEVEVFQRKFRIVVHCPEFCSHALEFEDSLSSNL